MRSKLALIFMLVAGGATAQQNNLYLNHQVHQFYEARLQEKGVTVHTSIRPWRMAEIDTLISYDSVFRLQRLPGEKFPGKLVNWIAYDNMVQVNTSDFHLSIDPLINFSGGIDLEDNKGSGSIPGDLRCLAISAKRRRSRSIPPFVKTRPSIQPI